MYGLSAFVPIRVLEQIKLDVCAENLPVVFAATGAESSTARWGQATSARKMLRR